MKFSRAIPAALALAAGTLSLSVVPRAARAEGPRPVIAFAEQKLAEENVEGPDVVRTYFTVGTKRMAYGVPKDCRLVIGDGFDLTPTGKDLEGVIHVSRSPFTPELDLAENALKYREAAADKIPKGSTGIEVSPPVINPYAYNGWKGLGFTWKYTFYGRPMQRTVSYINLELGVQVMVTTEAAQPDAEKVDKLAHQFMGSWWVMKDSAKKPDGDAAQ